MRERGLKFYLPGLPWQSLSSLPLRERGLKFNHFRHVVPALIVAPLAGAWIEIVLRPAAHRSLKVAPLAGAWIEIEVLPEGQTGSKVAPLAGAWIEITPCQHQQRRSGSLPLRERGLKFYGLLYIPLAAAVAPLAGAWIEILD